MMIRQVMLKLLVKILAVLTVALNISQAAADVVSPQVLEEPLRVFTLDASLSPSSGRMLGTGFDCQYEPGRYLCAESAANQALLFVPHASEKESYVKLQLSRNGAVSLSISPLFESSQGDLFVRLPGDAGVICRFMPEGVSRTLSVGVPAHRQGEYVWEKYEDQLKHWAGKAASFAQRPPEPPSVFPSSMADRLWFLSLWLKKASEFLNVDDATAREKLLREAALWEVMRIRPLDGWAFGIDDFASSAGEECMDIEENPQQEVRYCRVRGLEKVKINGPAVLMLKYRPELRQQPTPVLEDALLQVFCDGVPFYSDSVPFYPDYLDYDADDWQVEAELRRSPDGEIIGRPGSFRVLLPSGSHEIEFKLGENPVWWSVASARHLSHLEDLCSERLDGTSVSSEREDAFSLLVSAESFYRLGMCDRAEGVWGVLREKYSIPAGMDYIIDFRLSACREDGEILTPADLSLAFARLGVEAPASEMHWEDRRGELFRSRQLEDSLLAYAYSSPGLTLEEAVISGAASSAQKVALSALWHLDGIWQELEPPGWIYSEKYSLFQNRRLYPAMEALPGGMSLVRLGSVPVRTRSRLVSGVTRSTTLISSGEVFPAETILQADSEKVVLNDVAAIQKHMLLSDDDLEVAKISGLRDVWLQQRVMGDDEIADAKLVQVYPLSKETVYFSVPPEGYSGYAMLQIFVDAAMHGEHKLKAVVKYSGGEKIIDFHFTPSASDVALPVLESNQLRLVQPLSAVFRVDSSGGVLSIRLEDVSDASFFARLLLRLPEPPGTETQNKTSGLPVYPIDDAELSKDVEAIAELSRRLNSAEDESNAAYYRYERAIILCRLGRAGLAREDLLASGLAAGNDAVLREALIDLRERIESGQCNIGASLDRSLLPLPLDSSVETGNITDAELLRLKREFIVLSDSDDPTLEKRFDLCSRMAAIDQYESGCLPWYLESVSHLVLEGGALPPSFFNMLVRISAWQEKVQWPGAEKYLTMLLNLTHWETISSVESMDGLETIALSGREDIQRHPAEYSDIVSALTDDGQSPEAWQMFEGQSLMLHLPLPSAMSIGVELECYSLNPSVNIDSESCYAEIGADGVKLDIVRLSGSGQKLFMLNLDGGDHMLEIRHSIRHNVAAQSLNVRLFSSAPIPGVPSESSGGRYYLQEEPRFTFMRASAAYPLALTLLGPTMLRIDSWTRDGALTDVHLEVKGENGVLLEPLTVSRKGRIDLWLAEPVEYSIVVRPGQRDHALLRMYFREENGAVDEDIKLMRASHSEIPHLAEVSSQSIPDSQLLDGDDIGTMPKSPVGTFSLLTGYRRLLRDETGYVEPIDQFALIHIGYARRIENADLWLGISGEGRMRLSYSDSLTFDGRFYWITPGPEIHIDIQNRFAVQDVSTGVAGGNMLELTLKRPFEILPHWDITPLVSGWYKWQGINDWREDQIQPYTDADVYSPYLRDHPYTASAGVGTYYAPLINNSIFMRILAQSNSNFAGIDNVQLRAGDFFAFGRFQGALFYDLRPRFDDDDRDEFSLRQQLHVSAQYSWWPHSYVRIAPGASYDFYPHAMQHAFFGGLLLEVSPERGLRDAPPGEEAFSWQVDPERYWVREW